MVDLRTGKIGKIYITYYSRHLSNNRSDLVYIHSEKRHKIIMQFDGHVPKPFVFFIISRPGRSQGLLYKLLCHSLIQ